jgi:hypothetical protein
VHISQKDFCTEAAVERSLSRITPVLDLVSDSNYLRQLMQNVPKAASTSHPAE